MLNKMTDLERCMGSEDSSKDGVRVGVHSWFRNCLKNGYLVSGTNCASVVFGIPSQDFDHSALKQGSASSRRSCGDPTKI